MSQHKVVTSSLFTKEALTTHTNGAGTERVLYSGTVSGAPYKEAK